MNLRTILHHPGRIVATIVAAGVLFVAGTAAGSATTQPGTSQPGTTHPRQDVPMNSAADADTLYHYLTTLTPATAPRPSSPSTPTSEEPSRQSSQAIWRPPTSTRSIASTTR